MRALYGRRPKDWIQVSVEGLGFRVLGDLVTGLVAQGLGYRVLLIEFGVWGAGFGVFGFGV